MKKWLDSSRKERKETENLKDKGKEINWDEDMLERISALKKIQKKIACQNGFGHEVGNSEAKLADAVHLSEQNIGVTIDAAVTEEDVVNLNLKKMKTDKAYVLNIIHFMDQEEAKAIRSTAADTKSPHSFFKASPHHVAKVGTHCVVEDGPQDTAGPVKACITVQVFTNTTPFPAPASKPRPARATLRSEEF
ncbi:unnamed protein product [Peronospora farinosa]|uniref:Uncharacterized protein n=1 Tax=Peronospora farinosa TaxID=134698 RepID=A0AAV0T6M9_9STRA|nr:unnamed protein product [Peronospora farinosa]